MNLCVMCKKELNWEPLYTFEEGLRSTIDWYKNNREKKIQYQKDRYYNSKKLNQAK